MPLSRERNCSCHISPPCSDCIEFCWDCEGEGQMGDETCTSCGGTGWLSDGPDTPQRSEKGNGA